MADNTNRHCKVCNGAGTTSISRCGRCKTAFYCSRECQAQDWPSHKKTCGRGKAWYDLDSIRRCEDGALHEGKLELVTWDTPSEGLGWGACPKSESGDLKRQFEVRE